MSWAPAAIFWCPDKVPALSSEDKEPQLFLRLPRVWEEKHGLTVALWDKQKGEETQNSGHTGAISLTLPVPGADLEVTQNLVLMEKSGGTGLHVLQFFPVSYIVGIISQANRASSPAGLQTSRSPPWSVVNASASSG